MELCYTTEVYKLYCMEAKEMPNPSVVMVSELIN